MPRHLSSTPGSQPGRSRGFGSATETVYEPPSFPLNEAARSLLGDLSRSQNTAYKNQIRDSLRSLGSSVYDLQDRLQVQRQRLQQLQTRREERGIVSPEEDRLVAHIGHLERQVDRLTNLSEAAVRDVIDQRIELEDDGVILGEIYSAAPSNQAASDGVRTRRRRQVKEEAMEEDAAQDEEGDAEQPPPPSTLDLLREKRASKKQEALAQGPYQRYALDNEYAGFKRLWHAGLSGEDGPPLPDSSKWFRADGSAVMGTSLEEIAHDGDGGDSDEDVAVAREVISLQCPLSLRPLEEPYSNRKCKHTFEKSAILDYLNGARGPQQCPQTGCSQTFTKSEFATVFYLDQVILRKIQRAREAAENYEMEADSGDEDQDRSIVAGPERVKRRGIKQELADRSKRSDSTI